MIRAVVLVSAALLTACGSPEPEADCEDAPPALLEQIGESATVDDLAMGTGRAYLSPDYEQVWFVAAKFTVTGVDEEQTGVWATNRLDAPETIMAVDGLAQEFTTFTPADQSSAGIEVTDRAVETVKSC